jgi:group II intron reverse transcriptase/maturase
VRRSGDQGQADGEPELWGRPAGTNKNPRRENRQPRATEAVGDEEKSERSIVPKKPGNLPHGTRWREGKTERGVGNTEPQEGTMTDNQESGTISTKQARIAKLARQYQGTAMRTLAHHMDLEWLCEAFRRTRKDGAVGVDGQTAEEYAERLEENLRTLLDKAKGGTYRAPPVRRVHIPKGDGTKTRPIGIPTFEDKVLQRAVAMLLEPVYEQDFYDFSYGFRPRRSAHEALEALNQGLWGMGGGWVLDVDIKSFFDTLSHKELRDLLRQRVVDGVIVRLVGKWLRAGVMEGGVVYHPETGSPQGGVISPVLSNIYLHEVIDKWWVKDVLPRLRCRAFMVRYADDLVMVFSDREDAMRVQRVLPKRVERFGLTLHPEKTRLIAFRRPRRDGSGPKPGSFDFLGFTHYWGRSRKGRPTLKRKTAKDRVSRAHKALNQWMKRARHVPLAKQAKTLGLKLAGHYNYYGIRGNSEAINRFAYEARRLWRKWLGRRSQRARMTWEKFNRLLRKYPLPPARIRARELQLRLAWIFA